MDTFFLGVVSFISLLFLSGLVFIGSKRMHFPYTIALVAFGICIGLLVKFIPVLGFLTTFTLTEEILLYVFLPMLLFESAYNIRFREIIQHTRAIGILAVLSLLIAAIISSGILYYTLGWMGIPIPFLVLFAFGSLISATDPVSVLALFKEMGAPKRLTLIFEGESLFNDGTAVALLLVVLGILIHDPHAHVSVFNHFVEPMLAGMGSFGVYFGGFMSFVLMIVMGFVVGGFVGYGASRLIPYLQRSKFLEITLTLIIAHATFLFAEWINHMFIPVSPVIATTIAAMVMGNYGRYKLSTETRHIMGEYWEFFAFIANSMVFLLVGVMIVGLNIHFRELFVPIIISIIAVMIARAVSVYSVLIPLNATKKEYYIPREWMHLLSWGSLRGGLAIIMALFIPENFTLPNWPLETSIRDFVLALTVGCIIFTTFVKATSIPTFLKKFRITDPTDIETIDYSQGNIMFLLRLLGKIQTISARGFLDDSQKKELENRYHEALNQAHQKFSELSLTPGELENTLEKTLTLHALEMEKSILVDRFNHNEVPEWIMRSMLNKIDSQIERVESGKSQIKELYEKRQPEDPLVLAIENFIQRFLKEHDSDEVRYIKARTRSIILEKVLERFDIFKSVDEIENSIALEKVITRYKTLLKNAENTRKELIQKKEIKHLEKDIVASTIAIHKHDIIENLYDAGMISPKSKNILLQEYNIH